MNRLTATYIMTPDNRESECARFTIDDPTNSFILSNIMTVDQRYTFSFWVRSEAAGSLVVSGMPIETTSEWSKHDTSFIAQHTDLRLVFSTVGTYYIFHPQLERGTMATDWTPSPEDVEQSITDATDEVRETITEQNTSIISTCEELILAAGEKYVEVHEHDAFKQSVETELAVMSDEITMNFESTSNRIDTVNEDLQSEITRRSKHISFSEKGIVLSAGEHSMSIRIDNDIVIFEKGGVQFGWWDGIDFHTGNIMIDVTERAQFGNFAFVPRSDGSLSFLKVSHNTGFYVAMRGDVMIIYGAYPVLENNTMVITDVAGELTDTTLTLGGS